jgi:hypothetical protein
MPKRNFTVWCPENSRGVLVTRVTVDGDGVDAADAMARTGHIRLTVPTTLTGRRSER